MKILSWLFPFLMFVSIVSGQTKPAIKKNKPVEKLDAKIKAPLSRENVEQISVAPDSSVIFLLKDTIQKLKVQLSQQQEARDYLKKEVADLQDRVINLTADKSRLESEKDLFLNSQNKSRFSSSVKNIFLITFGLMLIFCVTYILTHLLKKPFPNKQNLPLTDFVKTPQTNHPDVKLYSVPTYENSTKLPKPIQKLKVVKDQVTTNQITFMDTNHEILPETVKGIFSNVNMATDDHLPSDAPGWYIVGASAIGSSHVKDNKPCDDNHYCISIENKWGVAVASDGAGSAANSQQGSQFISRLAAENFREAVINNKWASQNMLPSQEEWSNVARIELNDLLGSLHNYAEEANIPFKSLACTLIVVIFSPLGLLVTHIGDGRAGFCNRQGEWKSIMIPHKGEEANETVFVTSEELYEPEEVIISTVTAPEFRVINEPPLAFTLLTDGCEKHSFFCSNFDTATNKWSDPNTPSDKFFNSLVENLKTLKTNEVLSAEANQKWIRFLTDGTPGLKNEPDDKTMILGILI